MPGQSAYNATKYAVRGLTEALREELLDRRPPRRASRSSTRAGSRPPSRGARAPPTRSTTTPQPGSSTRSSPRWRRRRRRGSSGAACCAASRGVLVGMDAHALHQFARLTGARYQDVIARVHARLGGCAVGEQVGSGEVPAARHPPRLRHDQVGRPAALGVRGDVPRRGRARHWLGIPPGTHFQRPGHGVHSHQHPGDAAPPRRGVVGGDLPRRRRTAAPGLGEPRRRARRGLRRHDHAGRARRHARSAAPTSTSTWCAGRPVWSSSTTRTSSPSTRSPTATRPRSSPRPRAACDDVRRMAELRVAALRRR